MTTSGLVVCHISTMTPTQCGIATFTEALNEHLECDRAIFARMTFTDETPRTPSETVVRVDDPKAYENAAEWINRSDADVISLQHEYGIFGGSEGNYIQALLSRVYKPVVTTFHTVPEESDRERVRVMREIAGSSDLLVVVSCEARSHLADRLKVDVDKIHVIAHGVPRTSFVTPSEARGSIDGLDPTVITSLGHVRESKGYDIGLEAFAMLQQVHDSVRYVIVGSARAHRPADVRYQKQLRARIRELGLGDRVKWIDRYLPMKDVIAAAKQSDIGFLPYQRGSQVSSGVLALFLGCGRPVVATPFNAAKAIARTVPGVAVARNYSADSLAESLLRLCRDSQERQASMWGIYEATRGWTWNHAAEAYGRVMRTAVLRRAA